MVPPALITFVIQEIVKTFITCAYIND